MLAERLPEMRRWTKFAVAWLILAAVFATALGQLNIPTFLRLIRHGEQTTATIVQPDCGNHATASYSFSVGSTPYSGKDGMTNCGSLRAGDLIQIYYDVSDPTLNRAVEPRAGLMNEIISIALICLVVPPFIFFCMMKGGYWKPN
jgi:hypothetical protein